MTQPTEIDREHVMNIRETRTVVNSHETTRELDSARAKSPQTAVFWIPAIYKFKTPRGTILQFSILRSLGFLL